jgi:hypothetical protein
MRIRRLFLGLDYSTWRGFKIKYGLRNYDPMEHHEPAIFYGMYNKNHHNMLMRHTGLAVVIWAGSDSITIPPYLSKWCIENKHRVFHLAYSHWIKADLDKAGIKYIEKPIFGLGFDEFKYTGRTGPNIYHYYAHKERKEFYGYTYLKKIADENPGLSFSFSQFGQYKRDQLQAVYDSCFLGVRLTWHDQMALSVVEMGLLGKRSIFNGNLPCAIPYKDNDEVFRLIKQYWADPPPPDPKLAQEMREFTYDDEKWLNTEFYD